MSFLDSGGGGGKADPTGGGDPFGGGGGGGMPGGGGGDQMFAGDPTLTGDTGLPGMFSGAGPGSGATSTDASTGFTGNPINDPNVGAPQSQAPVPGTTPFSAGGVPSAPQSDTQIAQILKQLQGGGLRAQASPLEAAAQQAGGPPTTSPGQPTPDEAQSITGPGGSYGGGPTTTSTALQGTTGPNAAALQQQQAGGAERYPAAQAREIQQRIAEGQQTGTAGQAQRYSPTGPDQPTTTAPPPDPNIPKPEAPKTGDTTDTTGAQPPAAAAPASTGPVSSRGQPPGGGQPPSGTGAPGQQMNPLKIIGDALRGFLTGDFSPLMQDLAGQQAQLGPDQYGPGAYPGRSGGPRTSTGAGPRTSDGRTPQTDPNAPAGKPGAPDGPEPAADDVVGQRRKEWYQTHDRTDPYPEAQGPVNPKTGLGPEGVQQPTSVAGGGPVNWQQIAAMPPATHEQNFNQPFNANLKQARAQFFQYADTHPAFKRQLFAILGNEQGSNPQGTQATLESLVNRVNSENLNFNSPRATGWFQRGGYYDHGGGRGDPRVLEQSYQNVKNGSNISDYATDNASNVATRNARAGLARREVQTGRFRNQSIYHGEWFQSPGSEGNRPRYEQWRRQMEGPQSNAAPPNTNVAASQPARATGLDMLNMVG